MYYRSACATPSGSPCSSQQSVYSPTINDPQAGIIAPKIHSSWNPFEDDNFSKLTVEELLHKDFANLTDSKHRVSVLVYRIEESLNEPKYFVFFFFGHCCKTRRKDYCFWSKSHSRSWCFSRYSYNPHHVMFTALHLISLLCIFYLQWHFIFWPHQARNSFTLTYKLQTTW